MGVNVVHYRKLKLILLSIFVMCLPMPSAMAAQDGCEIILPLSPDNQDAYIDKEGQYCLATDFNRPAAWGHDGRAIGIPYMLNINASNVDIDLAGHALRSNRAFIHKVIYIEPYVTGKNVQPIRPLQIIRNIRLHEGTVKSGARFGVYFGGFGGHATNAFTFPISLWSDVDNAYDGLPEEYVNRPKYKEWVEKRAYELFAELPSAAANYPERNLVLENMHIVVTDYGALLQGAGTIVRNCVIEVDKQTALFIYGPRALIENNTIIVNGEGPRVEGDAPIRLHQGDGSIIRNNKIIRKANIQAQAITLVKSADVVVENNELDGFNENNLIRSFDQESSYRSVGNKAGNRNLLNIIKTLSNRK